MRAVLHFIWQQTEDKGLRTAVFNDICRDDLLACNKPNGVEYAIISSQEGTRRHEHEASKAAAWMTAMEIVNSAQGRELLEKAKEAAARLRVASRG